MARCPAGHESQASDYCDTCGLVIGGEAAGPAPVSAASGAPATTLAPTAVAAPGGAGCPVCQAERNGRFCEECGYDFDLAEAMPQVTVTPGIGPASPEPVAAPPDPPARTLVQPEPEPQAQPASEPTAAESEAESESKAEAEPESGGGDGGFDLDAELARAEAEAAAQAASASETSASSSSAPSPEAPAAAEPEPEPTVVLLEAEPAQPILPTRAPSFAGELVLVVDADRGYYDAQVERGDIVESEFPYPKYPHERRFSFTEGPVRIGRASSSRGLAPDIDLTGPPLDPAVSHLHAQLLRHEEGWVVVDLDSANGTRLNDGAEPLEAETEIPVKPGDRIHLGVWTTITIQ
jgi:FHA domain